MASLVGYSNNVQYISPTNNQGTVAGAAAPISNGAQAVATAIDGTPVRVAMIALSAAAGLVALHWAGFRFSLGVSA